ncbi:MAG: hypothetical protein JWL77_2786 [Chthonomonadaceae bacterium]|nr:hypothetical protein [Chthonomonadaceae bacterium]
MSAKSAKQNVTKLTATASNPQGELQKHLRALALDSVAAYRVWCREQGFGSALDKGWQERRREVQRAEKLAEEARTGAALEQHIRELRFETTEEYKVWCERHGLATSGLKTEYQRKQEAALRERERAAEAFQKGRRQVRKPAETLEEIYHERLPASELTSPALQAIHAAFSGLRDDIPVRRAFLQLLQVAQRHTDLIDSAPVLNALGAQKGNTYIDALHALAHHRSVWLRAPEDWRPATHNAHRQFGTLARHLLAYYPIPTFFDAAWFEGATAEARRHQAWFRHIGVGKNIRTAGLPISLTSRAAHLFLQAPADLPIEAALRWGQAQAIGAETRLCRALVATRLGTPQEDEEFWTSVLHFFVNNPMLDPDQIGPIVDFLHHRRFVFQPVVGPLGVPIQAIPEPNFSMKGRTVPALLRRVEEWHRELHRESRKAQLEWESRPDIAAFDYTERDHEDKPIFFWTIHELTSRRELQEEGKAMRHCVASYDRSCANGGTSIWSLRVRSPQEEMGKRVMTIEVQNHRRAIVQARGRCNKTSTARQAGFWLKQAPIVLKMWAAREKMTVATHL